MCGEERGEGRGVSFLQLVIGMQQQHLMQMNQSMMGGYASSTTVTTDLIQQVISSPPKSPSLFSPLFFPSFFPVHIYSIPLFPCLFLPYSPSFMWFLNHFSFLFFLLMRSNPISVSFFVSAALYWPFSSSVSFSQILFMWFLNHFSLPPFLFSHFSRSI